MRAGGRGGTNGEMDMKKNIATTHGEVITPLINIGFYSYPAVAKQASTACMYI